LKKYMQDVRFTAFLKECQSKASSNLDLASLLIQPVQRLPRYQLLINELLKHTEPDHVDYQNLNEALKSVKDLNIYINEKKRMSDNRTKISDLQRKITQMPLILEQAQRVLVTEGELQGMSNKNPRKRLSYVFLFNDMILRARTVVKDEKWEYEESLSLSGIELEKLTGLGFKLCKKDVADWTFNTKDQKEQDTWYEHIKQAIDTWSIHEVCNVEVQKAPVQNGIQILSATYGLLSDTRNCIEVTENFKTVSRKRRWKETYIIFRYQVPFARFL